MANEFKVKNGLVVSGSADIEQNLRVRGTLTVDELHTSIVTSSVLYESGSTKFGNSLDDNHSFTGSVVITGSINLNGQPLGTGKLDETTFNSYTSSIDVKIGGIESTTGSINSFTGSANSRLTSLESTTSSINSFTSSINTTINNIINNGTLVSGSSQINITGTTGFSTFSSSILTNIESLSSSIATTDDNQSNRLTALESTSASLNSYTSSNNTILGTLQIASNSLNLYTSSNNTILGTLQTATNSLNSYTSSNNTILGTLQTATNSLNLYTSSNNIILGTLQTATNSLNLFSSSTNTRLNTIEATTESLNTFTSSASSRLTSLESASGSIRSDFNNFTSSNAITESTQNSRLNALETSSSSFNSFTSSIDTTIKNKLNSDGVISGSVQVNITDTTGYSTFSSSIASNVNSLSSSVATTTNNLSTSVATTTAAQSTRLNSIEGKTGSYATTGSNSFIGNQTITGSLIVTQNLTILGSSSLMIVTSSQLAVSSSTISVNVFEPAERFGGLKVYDSGSLSHQATASLLWDSLNNKWIYQNASGSGYSGGMLIMGPRHTGSLGDEPGTITNVVMKGQGGDHITGSNITDDGTTVKINSNTVITGSIVATTTISSTNITAIETTTGSLNTFTSSADGRISSLETASGSIRTDFNTYTSSNNTIIGTIQSATSSLNTFTSSAAGRLTTIETSTGSLNSYTTSTNTRLSSIETSTGSLNSFTNSINTTIKSKLNNDNVLSGSYLGTASTTNLSEGTNLYYTDARVKTKMNTDTVHSGSFLGTASTTNLSEGTNLYYTDARVKTKMNADGVISGSAQIDLTATTNYSSGIKTRLNAENVHSGSFLGTATTANLSESGNLYYTDSRARAALSFSAGSGGYNSSTGVITIPTNTNQLTNGAGYITSYSETDTLATVTSRGATTSTETIFTGGLRARKSQTDGSYSSAALWAESFSNTTTGIAFHISGVKGSFLEMRTNTILYWDGNVVLHSGNYNSYSPTLTGGGASGTWNINVTGNANNITQYTVNQSVGTGNNVTFNTVYASTGYYHNTSSSRNKYNVYGSDGLYCIGMESGIGFGGLSDWGMTFQFNDDFDRGFWWGDNGHSVNQGAMALTTEGNLTVARRIRVGYGESDTVMPTVPLQVYGNGGTVVDIQGSNGQLFSVTDDLTGDIFSISDISGVPMINVNTTNGTNFGSTIFPSANNAYDLGTSTFRWANVYTNDLHLSNEGKAGGNEIDGTTGNWTIQEGAEQLYIINNKNGKKYKIELTEIK